MINIFSPSQFKKITDSIIIPIFLISILLFAAALYYALIDSPADYQQGEMVRIMYLHVPAAWMSLGIYLFIGVCSVLLLIWRIQLCFIMAISAAPIGCIFAIITLITGSLWGKPIWGAWWVWDARLTSMLVLCLLYISYIAITNSGDDIYRASKPASIVALLGVINVPIVKFSVDLWNSLHQPASIIRIGGPTIDSSMLLPLFLMFSAYVSFFLYIWILNIKILLLEVRNKNDLCSN